MALGFQSLCVGPLAQQCPGIAIHEIRERLDSAAVKNSHSAAKLPWFVTVLQNKRLFYSSFLICKMGMKIMPASLAHGED